MSRQSRPVNASEMRPGPTSSPASRKIRPNVTTWRTNPPSGCAGCDSARLLDERDESLVADRGEVLVVFQHRPERFLDRARIEVLPPECGERLGPVDRLGDAGRLRQIELPQPLYERRGLRREPVGDAGDAQAADLDLPLQRRGSDPGEETAALERVMQLPRAVR